MPDRPPRSEAFLLAVILAAIHALLLAFLIIIAWRTNAVMIMRKDAQPPPPLHQSGKEL